MYAILWEAFLDPSDSYFLFADLVGFYTHWTYIHIFRHIFLSNYWWLRSDIWSQASYMYPISWETFLDPSDSYSCLPTLLIFIHIEHTFCICPFFVTFFSATIDGWDLIFGHKLHICTPYRGKCFWTHQIPTSCLPKSGGIISEHLLTVHLVCVWSVVLDIMIQCNFSIRLDGLFVWFMVFSATFNII
jgi:hypothetical protein